MDKIEKALNKLSEKEKAALKKILFKIKKGDFKGLDLKKIKSRKDVFRVRKGDMRIIFFASGSLISILAIERRNGKNYK